jgi:hypothetical protein
MSGECFTTPGFPSACVGIWVELPTTELVCAQGDERIRRARGLIAGLDAMQEVNTILLPCLPSAEGLMSRLFADATRPGRLCSDKLKVLPAGQDPARRDTLAQKFHDRRAKVLGRLSAIGATSSLRSWRASLARLGESPRRPFAATRRIIKLARLRALLWVTDVRLAALRSLPPPHASVVAHLRRRRVSVTWFLVAGKGTSGHGLLGPKIVDVGCFPTAGQEGSESDAAVRRLGETATVIVAPSRHAATMIGERVSRIAVAVIPPAPLPSVASEEGESGSRQRLAEELRSLFAGGGLIRLHRHFCDFPFEQVEYLVAPSPRGPSPILPAYAGVLRRHRRNVKLLVDGQLPQGNGPVADVHSLGLSFDVAEAGGLPETARARLLRHARAVVVADLDGACLPPIFAEAVTAGTPVVLGRSPAVREAIPNADLSSPWSFDVGIGAESSLVQAILHVLDHGEEVLDRQRVILKRLAARTWHDVAAEHLRLAPRT